MKNLYLIVALLLSTITAQSQSVISSVTSSSGYTPLSRLTDNQKTPLWLTSPANTAGVLNVTFLLTKSIYTANIDISGTNRAFSLEISADGVTWKSMKTFTAGSPTTNIKIYNGGVAFNRIRLIATLAANTQMSIAEIGIIENPVKSVSAPRNFSSNVYTNAFDGNETTFYEFANIYGSYFTYTINLIDNIKAVKVHINANESNIQVNLTDPAGLVNEAYYNTLLANEEFLIINPQNVKTITLIKIITGATLNLNEIDVTAIDFSGTSMGFSYDAGGCMTTRTILFSATKAANAGFTDTNIPMEPPLTDMFAERKVLVYPNPTKGLLKVVVENKAETDNIIMQLYNIQGAKIHESTIIDSESSVNFIGSPNGTYLLNITVNGETHNWKIIKQ